MLQRLIFACLLTTATFLSFSQTSDWQTYWEKSGGLETPRYKETIEFSRRLAGISPMINYQTFGVSPQGRDLPLLILDKDGLADPEEIRETGRIVALVDACVHPGEAEGKDAILALLRDIAVHGKNDGFLNNVSVLFVPIFNVDGHERFSPYTRINQNGPAEGGWRTTAQNLNLNRDFVKADAPEMQDWLKLFNFWSPEFFIDCHTTDGADYQYNLTYEIDGYTSKSVENWIAKTYVPNITKKMDELDNPIFPYVTFRRWHDPKSGLYDMLASPRFSHGYALSRNCPGLLIETHMLKDYKTRVFATYDMVFQTLMILSKEKNTLSQAIVNGNNELASPQLRESCILKHETIYTDSTMVDFKGVDYTVETSDLTGGNWYKYNGEKKDFKLPYYNSLVPSVTVTLPDAYIIPAEWDEVIDRIALHDIEMEIIEESKEIEFETYKFLDTKWHTSPYEGRFRVKDVKVGKITRKKVFEKGSVVISTDQPGAYLIAFMLEPESEESFLRWGFFNAVFEQKEYVETYVMEKMAREMIAKEPGLKEEFEKWKDDNPEMAASQYGQLMFFYRKTPYFDSEWNVYPVGRIFETNN